MKKTYHIDKRMNQRGITQYMLDMALEFGDPKGDKVILNKKKVISLLSEIDILRKKLVKVCDKNGLVVIVDNEALITTYALR